MSDPTTPATTNIDERGRVAAHGLRAAAVQRPVPVFDPDRVRTPVDGHGSSERRRPHRLAGRLAVAAALLVVALAVSVMVVGRDGGGESARTDEAGSAVAAASTTEATTTTGAGGTEVLAFRPVLVDEEGTGGSADPPCAVDAGVAGGEVLPYRDLGAPSTSCITVGPIGFDGTDLSQVAARLGGASGGEWVIGVRVAPDARARANGLLNSCVDGGATCPTRRMAVVVGDEVLSAPTVESRDLADDEFLVVGGGPGGFTEAEARDLVARIQGR